MYKTSAVQQECCSEVSCRRDPATARDRAASGSADFRRSVRVAPAPLQQRQPEDKAIRFTLAGLLALSGDWLWAKRILEELSSNPSEDDQPEAWAFGAAVKAGHTNGRLASLRSRAPMNAGDLCMKRWVRFRQARGIICGGSRLKYDRLRRGYSLKSAHGWRRNNDCCFLNLP